MIRVVPIESKEEQAALCQRCGVPFREEMLAYRAETDGVLAGICQFTMNRAGGFLRDLAPVLDTKDDEALFVTGRAALNFINLCGINTGYFDGEGVTEVLLRRIGFSRNTDGRWSIDLDGFFQHPCQHAAH